MKNVVVIVGLVIILSGSAEASQLSNGLHKTWGYLTAPVNCLAQASAEAVQLVANFVRCVLGNVDPGNLVP